jgi:prepilin-type N-terminal cleavage/methylation domain-containing protein
MRTAGRRPSRLAEPEYQAGFTLVELLISAALCLTILGAVYTVFRTQSRSVKGQESRMEAQEYALSAVDLMVREIRNTGYFPTGSPCNNVANSGGVVSASAQSFRFVYDANGDGACEEDVTYAFDNGNITRNSSVLTDGNVVGFQLTYFPQQTSTTAPAPYCFPDATPTGCSGSLSANLAAVQTVAITITVRSKSIDTEFGGGADITMSSDAELRNHGLPS